MHFYLCFLCVCKHYLYPASVNEMPVPIALFRDYVDLYSRKILYNRFSVIGV